MQDPHHDEEEEPESECHDGKDHQYHQQAYVLFERFWNLPSFFPIALEALGDEWTGPEFAHASTFHN